MKEKIFKERNLKTLLSMCFAVAMMVVLLPMSGITVHAEYHQVTGSNEQTLKPVIRTMESAIQPNTTLKFIKKNGQQCNETVDGQYADINNALIRVDNGFKYGNQLYDIYIELTNIRGAARWSAGVNNADKYIYLKPTVSKLTGMAGYDYEVWLIKAGQSNTPANRATFLFVGGSCYMCGEEEYKRIEYCKPWSVDDKIYITENSQQKQLKYNDSIKGWTPDAGQELNRPHIVIFGEGTSAQHSIKGGYYCVASDEDNWNGEMKFGYVVNGSIIFKDAENNITVSNIPDGQITAKIPDKLKTNAPAGKHISGWKASQDVVLNNGTTIAAGNIIKNDQLDLILSYGNMTLTVAQYEDHNWTYSKNGNKIEAYCANCLSGYDENNKLQLTLSASTPNYTGEPVEPKITYGTEAERTAWEAAGLTLPNPNVLDSTEPGYIEKTYYNANGQETGDLLSAVPKNVGNYVVVVKVPYGTGNVTVSVPYRIRNGADTDDTEVKAGQGKITITDMKDDQEYIVTTKSNPGTLTEDDWNGIFPSKTVGPNGVVTGLDDGQTYYVYTRKKATADNSEGEPDPVGGPYYTNVRRPDDNRDGYTITDNTITITDPDIEVFSDESCTDKVADISNNNQVLDPSKTYYVRRKANGDNPPSTPFAFKLGEDVAPTGLETVPNTSPEGEAPNGKVLGATPDMQISTDDGQTWHNVLPPGTAGIGNEFTGLPNGKVLVRFRDANVYTTLWIGAGPSPSYENNGGGHVHEFEWGNWERVTKDENGTMVYQCKLCGYVLEKEYIPAYAYTCLTESEHVLKTPQNGSVICEMGRWNAYPRWFFEKLATRPDVNITLKFLYQHKQYTVYIPAGTKIDTECDWYGPMKICSLYQFEVK